MFKGHTSKEEEIVKRAAANFVKFNVIIYLLNNFFLAEILKGKMDLRAVHRSLEEATKQMPEWIKNRTSGIKYVQVSI